MFGLGGPELLVIGGIVLLLFGPAKLPALASSVGKSIRSFKKEVKDVREAIDPNVPDAAEQPAPAAASAPKSE